MLPSAFALIGVARSDYGGDEGFRKEVRKALEAYSRTQPIDDAVFDTFARGIYYVSGSFDDPKTYAELKRLLAQADRERGTQGNVVFYLATPPTVFPLITTQLGEAGMSRSRTANAVGRRREAVRTRRRLGARARRRHPLVLPRAAGLPHRPLPGQGDRPEHPRPALRERHLRARLEPQLHRPRADHGRRVARRRGPRAVLRGGRRDARHRAEPPAAGALVRRHGAARIVRRRSRCATSAARCSRRCAQLERGRRRARPVRRGLQRGQRRAGLPRRGRRRPQLADRDLRRRAPRRSTTGAGPRCRSTCAPASGSPSA